MRICTYMYVYVSVCFWSAHTCCVPSWELWFIGWVAFAERLPVCLQCEHKRNKGYNGVTHLAMHPCCVSIYLWEGSDFNNAVHSFSTNRCTWISHDRDKGRKSSFYLGIEYVYIHTRKQVTGRNLVTKEHIYMHCTGNLVTAGCCKIWVYKHQISPLLWPYFGTMAYFYFQWGDSFPFTI